MCRANFYNTHAHGLSSFLPRSAVVLGGVQQTTSPYLGPSPRANTYYASPIPAETSVVRSITM